MITVSAAMHVILGFLIAAFLLLLVLPAYRRRIERFATETLKRTLPLTEAEITADKDRIRADFAIQVHKLEMKLEDATNAAARQSIEINRRDAKIHDLEQQLETQRLSVEEHENARRVLEQAILDRLPKVESRLSEARSLLVQRDREIMLLTDSGSRQSQALEEATQINTQQRDELERLKTALDTRAARNRETIGDPRFDGEVALRSEIEELRAKTRDQANMIDRLQKAHASETSAANAATTDAVAAVRADADRLTAALAKAEARVLSLEASGDGVRQQLERKVADLESEARASAAEMTKMKAALQAFAQSANNPASGHASAGLSAKVEINQLQSEIEDQRGIIESLRAEIAGSNERLVRQAQHFRDELRRLGAASSDEAAPAREAPRRSLAERIAQPRVPGASPGSSTATLGDSGREARTPTGTFLKALNGGASDAALQSPDVSDGSDTTAAAAADHDEPVARRPRLLDRISGIDKP